MKYSLPLTTLSLVIGIVSPLLTLAASTGLVPCTGNPITTSTGTLDMCTICDFGQLIQNVINFILVLTFPVASLMFAWGGILYFMSPLNPNNIARAKRIIKNTLIGFLIALSAWFIVQTVMNSLVGNSFYKMTTGGWTNLCKSQSTKPVSNTTVSDWLGSAVPDNVAYVPATTVSSAAGSNYYEAQGGQKVWITDNSSSLTNGTAVAVCPSGYSQGNDNYCYGPSGDKTSPTTGTVEQSCAKGVLNTIYNACMSTNGDESYGSPETVIRTSDGDLLAVSSTGVSSSTGTLTATDTTGVNGQAVTLSLSTTRSSASLSSAVNTVNSNWGTEIEQACSSAGLNSDECDTYKAIIAVESGGNASAQSSAGAYGIAQVTPATACATVSSLSGCSNGSVSDASAVKSALLDGSTGLEVGAAVYATTVSKYGNNDNAIAAYNAGTGSGKNSDGTKQPFAASSDCSGMYAWQCTTNAGGFTETQGYVANINYITTNLLN